MKHLSTFLLLALAGSALSSCAVYMPATPGTPLVRSTGESEIVGQVSPGAFEASVAYVPAANILVTVEGGLHSAVGSATTNGLVSGQLENVHMQGGAGLGTYRLLGSDQSVYLGILAGLGLGSASIYGGQNRAQPGSSEGSFTDFLFTGDQLAHYYANYRRYYHQLYLAKTSQRFSYGASVRTTYIHFTELTRDEVPISSPTTFFVEPTVFVRYGPRAFQGQLAAGFSQPNTRGGDSPDQNYVSPANVILNVSVVLRPQLFRKRKASIE